MHPDSSYTWTELYNMPVYLRRLAIESVNDVYRQIEERDKPQIPAPKQKKNSRTISRPMYTTKTSPK